MTVEIPFPAFSLSFCLHLIRFKSLLFLRTADSPRGYLPRRLRARGDMRQALPWEFQLADGIMKQGRILVVDIQKWTESVNKVM